MKQNVKTESFSEMWKESEAEFLSEDSVDDTDNIVNDAPADDEGQSEVNDGKASVFQALVEDSQPEGELKVYEIDGVGSYSEDELKASLMKDKDYRQKTAELAEQRKKLEAAEQLWDSLQKDPVETVKKLARDIQAGVIQPASRPEQSGTEPSSDIDELVRQKVEEALASNEGLQSSKRERALAKVNVVFDDIERSENVELSETDRAMVIAKAQELGTTDLPFVFAGMLREAEKRQTAKANVRSTSNRGSGRGDALSDDADDAKLTPFQRATKEALAELGV